MYKLIRIRIAWFIGLYNKIKLFGKGNEVQKESQNSLAIALSSRLLHGTKTIKGSGGLRFNRGCQDREVEWGLGSGVLTDGGGGGGCLVEKEKRGGKLNKKGVWKEVGKGMEEKVQNWEGNGSGVKNFMIS